MKEHVNETENGEERSARASSEVGDFFTILGLIFLVPAMVGVIFVFADLMFGFVEVVAVTVLMAVSFAGALVRPPPLVSSEGGLELLADPRGQPRVSHRALRCRRDERGVLGHNPGGVAGLGLPPIP